MTFGCTVIGLGRFGMEVALSLAKRHFSVLAIDKNRKFVDEISEHVEQALMLDSTDEDALREAHINEMAVAVVAIGDKNIENSILTTALLRQLGTPRIIARASTDLHARILRLVGATEVINPEKEMGARTAQRISAPGLSELIPLADNAALAELNVPSSFIGRTILEMRVRSRYGVNIIALRRLNISTEVPEEARPAQEMRRAFILNPDPEERFRAGDILVVAGTEEDVRRVAALS
ncbi:MAG: TrkA family potassium uptake protein [bacterium]|nr:TrkA family potassium uptake protein [bacterium]